MGLVLLVACTARWGPASSSETDIFSAGFLMAISPVQVGLCGRIGTTTETFGDRHQPETFLRGRELDLQRRGSFPELTRPPMRLQTGTGTPPSGMAEPGG